MEYLVKYLLIGIISIIFEKHSYKEIYKIHVDVGGIYMKSFWS